MGVVTALKCDECDELLEISEKEFANEFAAAADWEYDESTEEARCDTCKSG